MKKRGSLNLSVNAIVVFILAFSMLGVGLYFINNIREKMDEGTTGAFNIEDLKNPPTAERPLIVPDPIEVKRNSQTVVDLGFYAKSAKAHGVQFEIESCIGDPVPGESDLPIPQIETIPSDVEQGEGMGFKVNFKENGLNTGTSYICKINSLAGRQPNPSDSQLEVYESQNFELKVKS